MSGRAQRASRALFGTLAALGDALLSVLIGMAAVDYAATRGAWDGAFAALAMPVLLVARAANIFPLCALVNHCRGARARGARGPAGARISGRMQCVMWWSGLKGAVSFALAMTLNDSRTSHKVVPTAVAEHLVTTTLTCVLVTNLVVAPLTAPLLRRLRLDTEPGAPNASATATSATGGAPTMPQPLLAAGGSINGAPGCGVDEAAAAAAAASPM